MNQNNLQCLTCRQTFKSSDAFLTHIEKIHGTKMSYKELNTKLQFIFDKKIENLQGVVENKDPNTRTEIT